MSEKSINELVKELQRNPDFREGFVVNNYSPAQESVTNNYPSALDPLTTKVFQTSGVNALYQHQNLAISHMLKGSNVAISTGTSSGKSLCYLIPILDSLIKTKTACSLLLYPTKALCHDQKNQLSTYLETLYNKGNLSVDCGVYDGDTVRDERKRIRDTAQIVLSNPDMFNIGIMPNHTEWRRFFTNLKYVVIDEIHVYRGIFGSHFTNLIRRLKRICKLYGSHPQFILCSATLSNITEFSYKLIEEPIEIVEEDFSQKGEKHFLIYNPPFLNKELGIRRSYLQESIRILRFLRESDFQILFFARSRRNVEMIFSYLEKKDEPVDDIRTYRSGYLASTRRDTEIAMKKGNIQTVIATNALELGIDIGGIDIVILCGYPGTIAGTRQQSGRAGRRNKPSLTILITTSDPLEQYLAFNPDYLFKRAPEQALIEPDNPYIILSHLSSAIFELPFRIDEKYGSLSNQQLNFWLNLLQRMNKSKLSNNRYFWISEKYPAEEISLRMADPSQFALMHNNRIIGKLDKQSAFWMAHPGAVYLQEGSIYVVEDLDLEKSQILLREEDPGYYTEHMTKTEVEILETLKIEPTDNSIKYYGKLKVTTLITGFRKIHWTTKEILDYGKVNLPPSILLTTGYWFGLNPEIVESLKEDNQWFDEANYYGKNWDNVRASVLLRDENKCQACGKTEPQRLEIHHKTPFKMYRNKGQANELNNLVTLCPSCHKEAEAMVKVQSGLSGLSFILHNLAPLFLMCERSDVGVHQEAVANYADQLPAILFYDSVPGGIGLSEKLFYFHKDLLEETVKVIRQCECLDGCPSCTGPVAENGWGAKSIVDLILKGLLK